MDPLIQQTLTYFCQHKENLDVQKIKKRNETIQLILKIILQLSLTTLTEEGLESVFIKSEIGN